MKYFAECLQKITKLEKLDLSYNNLGENENNIKCICEGFKKLSKLKSNVLIYFVIICLRMKLII